MFSIQSNLPRDRKMKCKMKKKCIFECDEQNLFEMHSAALIRNHCQSKHFCIKQKLGIESANGVRRLVINDLLYIIIQVHIC